MPCSLCAAGAAPDGLSVLELRLCRACAARLARASAARREYAGYVAHVRRCLAEPLLAAQAKIVPIAALRAGGGSPLSPSGGRCAHTFPDRPGRIPPA